jgi:hypothetical protein
MTRPAVSRSVPGQQRSKLTADIREWRLRRHVIRHRRQNEPSRQPDDAPSRHRSRRVPAARSSVSTIPGSPWDPRVGDVAAAFTESGGKPISRLVSSMPNVPDGGRHRGRPEFRSRRRLPGVAPSSSAFGIYDAPDRCRPTTIRQTGHRSRSDHGAASHGVGPGILVSTDVAGGREFDWALTVVSSRSSSGL